MLYPPVKNNGIEVVPVKLVRHDGFKYTYVELFPQIDPKSVHGKPFFGIADFVCWPALIVKKDISSLLCPKVGQLKSPDFSIQLEKQVGVGKIRKDHRPVTFSCKVPVLTKLGFDVPRDIETQMCPCRKEAIAGFIVPFPKSFSRYCSAVFGKVLDPRGKNSLCGSHKSIESDLSVYASPDFDSPGIAEAHLIYPGLKTRSKV